MNKYVLGIDGMGCGACEAHVKNVVRKKINVKKIKASHTKNLLVVFSEADLKEDDFHKILDPTGYEITSFERLDAVKSLFGWR